MKCKLHSTVNLNSKSKNAIEILIYSLQKSTCTMQKWHHSNDGFNEMGGLSNGTGSTTICNAILYKLLNIQIRIDRLILISFFSLFIEYFEWNSKYSGKL